MEAKITLTYQGVERIIESKEFKNWGDVMCSYSRDDYGGVVRKFTSKFDFCGDAMRFLLDIYLADGVEAQCSLDVYEFTESWEYRRVFGCPLDFSSVSWDDYVLSISSVDSSLAAMIKSDKGTKYEFVVGEDILPDGLFTFDRIPMAESATYAFTQGESDPHSAALDVTMAHGEQPWLGNIGSEILINGMVLYADDQETGENSYAVKAEKDVVVDLEWDIDIDTTRGSGTPINLKAEVPGHDSMSVVVANAIGGNPRNPLLGTYDDAPALMAAYPPTMANSNSWAMVGSDVWVIGYNGRTFYWENTGQTREQYEGFHRILKGKTSFNLTHGMMLRISAEYLGDQQCSFRVNSSSFRFTWQAIGEKCDIPCFHASTVAKAILRRMAAGRLRPNVILTGFDQRLNATRLMAAESIRGIDGAKLYTSFNEFCDWMSAVFGYTYTVGEAYPDSHTRVIEIGPYERETHTCTDTEYTGSVDPQNIYYIAPSGYMAYKNGETYHRRFRGSEAYMDENGRPLADAVYTFPDNYPCVFWLNDSFQREGLKFNDDLSLVGKDAVNVLFTHRSELYADEVGKEIENVKDLRYSVTAAQIYSTIEVGYDKKDYGSVNGRDEFNFSHTYATGSMVSGKKLSLMSKYRADSYGIEFACQKRGEDSTDTQSDSDVFFALTEGGYAASPDRTSVLEGVLSQSVFNAAFSPKACLLANADYIAMQGTPLRLAFASSTGNSSVIVDGQSLDSDVTIDESCLTAGTAEFSTDDQEPQTDFSQAVRFVSNGIEYVGFISDLDVKWFRSEAAKYKILIKSVRPI